MLENKELLYSSDIIYWLQDSRFRPSFGKGSRFYSYHAYSLNEILDTMEKNTTNSKLLKVIQQCRQKYYEQPQKEKRTTVMELLKSLKLRSQLDKNFLSNEDAIRQAYYTPINDPEYKEALGMFWDEFRNKTIPTNDKN